MSEFLPATNRMTGGFDWRSTIGISDRSVLPDYLVRALRPFVWRFDKVLVSIRN